jgi:hypothetical protein
MMSTPGAHTRTHVPTLLKLAIVSSIWVAPTAMEPGEPDGLPLQASAPELPAETTTGTPAATSACTAWSTAPSRAEVPRLMLMTARRRAWGGAAV